MPSIPTTILAHGIAAALGALAAPAAAVIAEPPAQFRHPYAGELISYELPAPEIDAACRALGAGGPLILGCARRFHDLCVIIVPSAGSGVSPRTHAALRRHELAHCNGWPADHAGAQ